MERIRGFTIVLLGIVVGILIGAVSARADCDRPSEGSLCVPSADSKGLVEIPLKHTSVRADVSGLVASVEVTQTFTNPADHAIEAVYVFPLPENAAVNDMVMRIGDRTIRGLIKKRDEARATYEQARAQGHTASLLEQERPNIFTQSVANIEPGHDILVTIRYVQDLRYDRGEYEFAFPMVVGPRYMPGSAVGAQGGGWSPDTTRVPDASRISPHPLAPGTRSGHDISLTLALDAGVPIQNLESPSHKVAVTRANDHRAEVTLDAGDAIPNKDFILRYAVAGKKPELALLTHRDGADGYFLLMVQPPTLADATQVSPKEMIFVLDTSGSMSGEPIAKVKEAMRHALRSMNPDDTFQIIQFNSQMEIFPKEPLTNTPENVRRALSYINGIDADGGTEMLQPIEAALGSPADPKRLRIVCLMTDGYIGNEREIFDAIQRHAGTARVFVFGVGSSVNRYLVTESARLGRGEGQVIGVDEPSRQVVERFYNRIAKPLLTDVSVDWGSLSVRDLQPGMVPDLFAEQPLIIKGRYDRPGHDTIAITGKLGGRSVSFPLRVVLPERDSSNEAVASLWGRARIETLERQQDGGSQEAVVKEITDLALQFRLMSAYTSFVAVDEKSTVDSKGQLTTVQVPVEMPEGMSMRGMSDQVTQMNSLSAQYEPYYAKSGVVTSAFSAVVNRPLISSRMERSISGKRVFTTDATGNWLGARQSIDDRWRESADSLGEQFAASGPTAQPWTPTPKFEVTIGTSDQRGQRVLTLTQTGELWLAESDATGTLSHRRIVRTLTLAELDELSKLIDSSGLSQGPDRQFGAGEATLTIVVRSGDRVVRWTVAGSEQAQLPADAKTLLEKLGATIEVGATGASPSGLAMPNLPAGALPNAAR